jgi:hypothetical protein
VTPVTAAPDALMLRHLVDIVGPPIALYPHDAGAERWIAALHLARTYLGCDARLLCVVDNADRARVLRRQITELALATAHVVVPDDDAQRAACAVAAVVTLDPSDGQPTALARVLVEIG